MVHRVGIRRHAVGQAGGYQKFNPANHVENWKTPMLVVQGDLDFRIPTAQGLSTFTALQRRGIDSRLIVFPNENTGC